MRTGNPRHAIVRTAWVLSPTAQLPHTMLRLAAERERLGVVDDQRGCPTSAADLAAALAVIALRLAATRRHPPGTFHCVNAGETSGAASPGRSWPGGPAGRTRRAGRPDRDGGLPDPGPAPGHPALDHEPDRRLRDHAAALGRRRSRTSVDRLVGPVRSAGRAGA